MESSYVEVVEPSLEISQFSTAVFHNVAESYLLGTELHCEFSLNLPLKNAVDDGSWIGVFRVGWENTNDCLSKYNISQKDDELRAATNKHIICIRFDLIECNLSGEEDEFYQFCFVNNKGDILGASCPFQLKSGELNDNNMEWWFDLNAKDRLEEVIEDDAILVHNKTTLLEESLGRYVEENSALKTRQTKDTEKIRHLEELVADFETSTIDSAHQCYELQESLKQANLDVVTMKHVLELERQNAIMVSSEVDKKAEEIKHLQQSAFSSEGLIADFTDKLKSEETKRTVSQHSYEIKISSLQQTIADLRTTIDNSSYSETMIKEQFDAEIDSYTKMYEKLQFECLAKQDEADAILLEKDTICAELIRCQQELNKQEIIFTKEKEDLKNRLAEAIGLLIAGQRTEDLQSRCDSLQKELKTCSEEKDSLNKQYEECLSTIEDLRKDCASITSQLEMSQSHIILLNQQQLEATNELKMIKTQSRCSDGSNHALRVACSHMQKQITQLKLKNSDSNSDISSIVISSGEQVNPLQKEVDELKLRLCMGGNAYRKKVLECKELMSKVEKLTDALNQKEEAVAVAANQTEQQETAEKGTQVVALTNELEKFKSECKQLKLEKQKTKLEQENVVSVLLFEIQKLAEKVEDGKKQDCSQPNTVVDQRKEKQSTLKPKLKDLAESSIIDEPICHQPEVRVPKIYPHLSPSSFSGAPLRPRPLRHSHSEESTSRTHNPLPYRTVRQFGSDPVVFCPVCGMHFPQGFTDKAATDHVNSHFL